MVTSNEVKPLMECGHTANATRDGEPVCAICIGINPGAVMVHTDPPDLTGRRARCSYARPGTETHSPSGGQYRGREFPSTVDSSLGLAFFEHRPEQVEDRFYCGCWGWD